MSHIWWFQIPCTPCAWASYMFTSMYGVPTLEIRSKINLSASRQLCQCSTSNNLLLGIEAHSALDQRNMRPWCYPDVCFELVGFRILQCTPPIFVVESGTILGAPAVCRRNTFRWTTHPVPSAIWPDNAGDWAPEARESERERRRAKRIGELTDRLID